MCMKNVNATSKLYDYVEFGDGETGNSIFQNQFDVIVAKFDENRHPYIGNFYVVSDINMLGTTSEADQSENIINAKKNVEFKIRVTKISSDANSQYSWNIDTFSIDLSEEGMIHDACVPYANFTKVSKVTKIQLKPNDYCGNYVVKILIRTSTNSNDNLWVVQSISHLSVK